MPFVAFSIDRAQISGFSHYSRFLNQEVQCAVLHRLLDALPQAPLFTPLMPRTGRPFSVRITNFGSLGWVSDRKGYRYQQSHPQTGLPWPTIPEEILAIWRAVSNFPRDPECCLVNYYGHGAKMGLHRDQDEDELEAPVVSISLGDAAIFRLGGHERRAKTIALKLLSGDVLVMGGASRLRYHGIDRVVIGSSTLLPAGGRINLTLRRVTKLS